MKKKFIVMLILIVISAFYLPCTCSAEDIDLAQSYSPIFYFEKDEICYPVDVSYYIDNSELYEFVDDEKVLIDASPSIEELSNYSIFSGVYENPENFFLDNTHGTIGDDGVVDSYQSMESQLGYTVYSRVYSSDSNTIIQYWMFYVFNKGPLNVHEADWEMVQILLSNNEPTQVMYSQHYGGQKATWEQVEKEGNHIKVYVARGTHANYLRSYSGVIGVASDVVGANGKILNPTDYTLDLLEDQGWLDFAGRWGEYAGAESIVRGQAGPYGPKYYGRTFRESEAIWFDPVSWSADLSQADNNMFVLEWFFYNFIPIFIIISIISLLIIFFRMYLRNKKYGLGPRILSLLYIDGINLKSIGNIICIVGIIVAIFGLFNQWYAISADIDIPDKISTGLVDLIVIDGIKGIQVNLLDSSGSLSQFGNFALPFSFLIGIGLVFFILGTIGISKSNKLGKKSILRGLRLLVYVIIILIGVMIIGSLAGMAGLEANNYLGVSGIFDSISNQPFGGVQTLSYDFADAGTGSVFVKWGLGFGGQLLLIACLLLIISGVLEMSVNTKFFEEKSILLPEKKPKQVKKKQDEENVDDINKLE